MDMTIDQFSLSLHNSLAGGLMVCLTMWSFSHYVMGMGLDGNATSLCVTEKLGSSIFYDSAIDKRKC